MAGSMYLDHSVSKAEAAFAALDLGPSSVSLPTFSHVNMDAHGQQSPVDPAAAFVMPPQQYWRPPCEHSIVRPSSTDPEEAEDPAMVPSVESGGIPDPTAAYLEQAERMGPAYLTLWPQPILVVIDLNGTLLFRPNPHDRPLDFYARAHVQPFLHYCLQTFRVLIWSSATPKNAAAMWARLAPPNCNYPLTGLWARDRLGLSPSDFARRVQCYKRLSLVWADPALRATHPHAADGAVWDQTNTVLIDDSAEKARSEPYNLLEIPTFTGQDLPTFNILPQVHDYLNALSCQVDVSRFIRCQPFLGNSRYNL